MGAFFQWIAKACDEDPGVPSSMRLVVVYGCFVSVTLPGILWVLAVWIPAATPAANGASLFCGSALAALLTAKFMQKGRE